MATDRKSFSLMSKQGKYSTITFLAGTIDLLEGRRHDVPEWIQSVYIEVEEQFPQLTDRAKIEKVRSIVEEEANESLAREALMP